ncbi:MAG: hypothetical protein ACRDFZ_06810 [Candidatus Limnocylindria bacterium]
MWQAFEAGPLLVQDPPPILLLVAIGFGIAGVALLTVRRIGRRRDGSRAGRRTVLPG